MKLYLKDYKKHIPSRIKDLTGKVFGRLTVLHFGGTDENGHAMWKVQCVCGAKKRIKDNNLKTGNSKSCGCWQHVNNTYGGIPTHGLSSSPEYICWSGMWQRCTNENSLAFPNYGGRGIKVCERWRKFENFFEDMGARSSPKHSLDRIDNDGDYTPDNCRWATKSEQQFNRQDNWGKGV